MENFPQNLKESEALELLGRFGSNELPESKKQNFFIRYSKLFKEPMILLLIAASTIYMILGDFGEGALLGSFVFIVISITIYQERKSENALASLRELSSPRSMVIRENIEKIISSKQIVPGDLVAIKEGDRVPADGIVLQSSHLSIDESLLTGESFPIKDPKEVFSSTLVVSGSALIRVMKTGILTEVGIIGKSLDGPEEEELNLNKEIRKIIKLFAWTGFLICIAIVLIYGFTHSNWIEAFLIGLATQMTLLPEEFPIVLTIFLALGAWRLSKVNVLIRKPVSIERLGAVSVLCVDKTGTLTLNQMSVSQLNNSKKTQTIDSITEKNLADEFHEVIEFGVLGSHLDPFDPMEKAIRSLAEKNEWGKEHLHEDWQLIHGYPLSSQLLAMSCVWKKPNEDSYIISSKGAPEAIMDLCHLESEKSQEIIQSVKEMAQNGLRVLGVARAKFTQKTLPSDQHDFDFEWLGLIGLEDPLRPEVPRAVELCRNAGIRVIMMTGDYPETALKIAERAGIDTDKSLITGKELDTLSEEELIERLKTVHIFARMIPNQKLRIVRALKEMGHIVAMTGDGVNDAPSLKWADIGIAMGGRGTDVAREASDIVLLDDQFSSIVSGVERGRLIFKNIKKAMSYIASIHVPIAGLSIMPVILNWPLILIPIHIVFLQLVIDPACSLMFESQASEEGVMQSPPRSIHEKLFSGKDLLNSFLQGGLMLMASMALFWVTRSRSLVFTFLSLSNIGLIFADMSGGSIHQLKILFSKISNIIIVVSITSCLILINNISGIRSLFKFEFTSFSQFLIAFGLAVIYFIVVGLWNRAKSVTA
jgi:Ca2+-transporting ATPase